MPIHIFMHNEIHYDQSKQWGGKYQKDLFLILLSVTHELMPLISKYESKGTNADDLLGLLL